MMLAQPFLRLGFMGAEILAALLLIVLTVAGFFCYVLIRYPKRHTRR